jgi:hypothetical protein
MSRVIENIRKDKTWILTYGYVAVCVFWMVLGAMVAFQGDVKIGLFMIAGAAAGVEMWTAWGEMKLRDLQQWLT